MPTSIRIAKQRDDIAACMALRWAVFVEEQGVSEAEEIDGKDDICSHVLAKIDGKPAGAARFMLLDDNVKIQRVCVPKASRGMNIGADIIRFIVNHAAETTTATSILLSAQVHALEFYRKLGFAEEGQEYLDAEIPHMDMRLRLPL